MADMQQTMEEKLVATPILPDDNTDFVPAQEKI